MSEVPDLCLGDSVYASFDGWHIWLEVRDDNRIAQKKLALDPSTFEALQLYADKCWGEQS